jgi:hypothetical protein
LDEVSQISPKGRRNGFSSSDFFDGAIDPEATLDRSIA